MKVRKILEDVLKLLPNSSGENAREMSLEELHIKLSVALKGEKYLLILYDFWNDDPDAWGRLRSILDRGAKTLLLHGCMRLQELPPHIGRLEKLRHLTLTTKQKHLPSEMGSLIALRKLTLYECHALTSFPQSMRNTENLEELWIVIIMDFDA
ncbi:hypothetical protein V2J09_023566 [Rumex salicifolius]